MFYLTARYIAIFTAIAFAACGCTSHLRAAIVDDDDIGPWDVVWLEDPETGTETDSTHRHLTEIPADMPTIMGASVVDPESMYRFVAAQNPEFQRAISDAFHSIGQKYGVRGDIAFCQAILETGWFKFTGGTKVTPDQHNYCGLGVTRIGMKGHSFDDIESGVTAQLQHLYAYAVTAPLPKGERLIDPRFGKVTRGCAPTWHDLSGRWAANPHYATRILNLYRQLIASASKCKE